jgi:uncharacterized phage protein gp47/JayE
MNSNLDTCHCCEGLTAETPVAVENRPGLSAIAYRVGTHSQFKDSMLAALSDITRTALQSLKTREDDDFSIALLDAAATMADVLTFYQERIANESYLRTATERGSLLELARLIGYELRPGVAASVYLAFTIDESSGMSEATVDLGTKVQSVPGQNEVAQTFETVEEITARVEWNAIKPQMTRTFIPQSGDTHVYLKGTATNVKSGDAILFVGSERENHTDSDRWDFRRVTAVTSDYDNDRTLVEWADGLGTTSPENPNVYALRVRASLFGYNAPHPKTLSWDLRYNYDVMGNDDWSFKISQTIDLDTTYSAILANSWLVLSKPGGLKIRGPATNLGTISSRSLARFSIVPLPSAYQKLYRAKSVIEAAQANYTLAGKTTQVTLDTDDLGDFAEWYRETMVFAQSELLEIAESPYFDDTGELLPAVTGATIPLAQAPPDLNLTVGQWLAASGTDSTGEAIAEMVQISAINDAILTVTPALDKTYVRDSFSLNANIAHATHGETVSEILGSGDASEIYQEFTLKQPPLTYVSASTPSGAASTLEVRVNDLLWDEASTLFGRDTDERVYITSTDDDGNTTIEFGDGITGARVPSGSDNVRAEYRKGIGVDGLVTAGQLTSLLTRPLGIRSVGNPEDATGAEDRESLDDARTNAPLTVLTLDRVVSLQDYEDFSRAFAGIAKALATWTWDGRTKAVFITVAGTDGAEIPTDSDTYTNLLSALQLAGDPFVSLRVQSYRDVYFKFAGKVKVDAVYETDSVLAAVETALREQFSFDVRAFGQPVFLSEVIAAVQEVPGVIAVDVDRLYRTDSTSALETRLLAALPETLADGSVVAAELLTLHSDALDALEVMS